MKVLLILGALCIAMAFFGAMLRTHRSKRRIWSGLAIATLVVACVGAEKLSENLGMIALILVLASGVVGYTLAARSERRRQVAEATARANNPFTLPGYGKGDDFNIV